jgi:hypothetical protein
MFNEVLDCIYSMADAPPDMIASTDTKESEFDDDEVTAFLKEIRDITSICIQRLSLSLYLLWLMGYSSAIEDHIARTAISLDAYLQSKNVDYDLDEMGERIDSSQAEGPSTREAGSMFIGRPERVVVAFMRWLRQLVATVQSVDILYKYARGLSRTSTPPPTLSVKCVAIHRHQGREMYDWRDLVTELFTTRRTYRCQFTAAEIIEAVVSGLEGFGAENQSFKGDLHPEACLASLAHGAEHVLIEFQARALGLFLFVYSS